MTEDVAGLEFIARGRSAEVWAVSSTRVLRRYTDGNTAEREAPLMAYVRVHGFPVPQVYAVEGPDLVMERIHGPTMVDALASGELDIAAAGRLLADLHQRLHDIPSRSGDPATRVVHLDLHPHNVLMATGGGPTVIDWTNACDGPPDLDVAMSALILAEVVVSRTERAEGAGELLAAFLSATDSDPVSQLEPALRLRGADPNLSADEVEALGRAGAVVRDVAARAARR